MKVFENISLRPYNTFGIDVEARRLVLLEAPYAADVAAAIAAGWMREPHLVVGSGSNIVFTQNYDGTIFHLVPGGIELRDDTDSHSRLLIADAGLLLDDVVDYAIEQGLYGMENLSAIPGTVGASAVQNVGAYGVEAKDVIHCVEAIDLDDGTPCCLSAADCQFAYRDSLFKHHPGRYLITRVAYRLSTHFVPHTEYQALAGLPADSAATLRQAITDLRWQKLPRPEQYGSAGSFFKNPVVAPAVATRLKTLYPDMPLHDGCKLSAAWLIDRCGWKGRTMGRAAVWPRQALVLYNNGGCTGAEVVALAQAIVSDVEQKFNLRLEPEAIII